MRFRLTHVTRYAYSAQVDLAQHVLHLDVRRSPIQDVEWSRIDCVPGPAAMSCRLDHFGNRVTHLSLGQPHDSLSIAFTAEGLMRARSIPDETRTPPWEEVAGLLRGDGFPGPLAESEFVPPSPLVPASAEVTDFARPCFPRGAPILACVRRLARAIHTEFRYDPFATGVATPLAQAFRLRAGVCQDFAHLQIAALRGLGLAARYVSGYLATRPPRGCRKARSPWKRALSSERPGISAWSAARSSSTQSAPARRMSLARRIM